MSHPVLIANRGPSKTILSSPFLGIKVKRTVPTIPVREFRREQLDLNGEVPDPSLLYKPEATMARSQYTKVEREPYISEDIMCSCFGFKITKWREPTLEVDEIDAIIGTEDQYIREKELQRNTGTEDPFVDVSETTLCSCFGVTLTKWRTNFRVRREIAAPTTGLDSFAQPSLAAAAASAETPMPPWLMYDHQPREQLPSGADVVFRYGGHQEKFIHIPQTTRPGIRGTRDRRMFLTTRLVDMGNFDHVREDNRILLNQLRQMTGRRPGHEIGFENEYSRDRYERSINRARFTAGERPLNITRARSRSPLDRMSDAYRGGVHSSPELSPSTRGPSQNPKNPVRETRTTKSDPPRSSLSRVEESIYEQ